MAGFVSIEAIICTIIIFFNNSNCCIKCFVSNSDSENTKMITETYWNKYSVPGEFQL